jgi:type III restriction enzyme
LEAEGVGVGVTKTDPPQPVTIYPVKERQAYDIAIPITKPLLIHNFRRLSSLDPTSLDAVYDREELSEVFRIGLRMEFATVEAEVHRTDLAAATLPISNQLIGSITNKVIQQARLTNAFAEVYPLMHTYIETRCFGRRIDLESEAIRSHLSRLEIQEGIAKYLARKIGELTVERRSLEFERADHKLSDTRPFTWRRNLPPLEAKRTVFNYVATFNPFERQFAAFLDRAGDIVRFASLGTTEQGESGTSFRVDYLKPSGGIGFYHPDWVVVQKSGKAEINWIVETKGRVWEDTFAKDAAISDWCKRVSAQTGSDWRYVRVDQTKFGDGKFPTFEGLLQTISGAPMLPV